MNLTGDAVAILNGIVSNSYLGPSSVSVVEQANSYFETMQFEIATVSLQSFIAAAMPTVLISQLNIPLLLHVTKR